MCFSRPLPVGVVFGIQRAPPYQERPMWQLHYKYRLRTKYRLVVGPQLWLVPGSHRCGSTLVRLHKVYQPPLFCEI